MPVKPARMNTELPPIVEAIRGGWMETSQAGAVVSGLLAGVAAQLLSYFRDSTSYTGRVHSQTAVDVVVALCYGALFFNIGATISAFIIIDKLGSLTLTYARLNVAKVGQIAATEAAILEHYGAGSIWRYILLHWIFCFYSGTVCLALLLLTFIWLQESYWIGVLISVIAMISLIPILVIIKFEGGSGNSGGSEDREFGDSPRSSIDNGD